MNPQRSIAEVIQLVRCRRQCEKDAVSAGAGALPIPEHRVGDQADGLHVQRHTVTSRHGVPDLARPGLQQRHLLPAEVERGIGRSGPITRGDQVPDHRGRLWCRNLLQDIGILHDINPPRCLDVDAEGAGQHGQRLGTIADGMVQPHQQRTAAAAQWREIDNVPQWPIQGEDPLLQPAAMVVHDAHVGVRRQLDEVDLAAGGGRNPLLTA